MRGSLADCVCDVFGVCFDELCGVCFGDFFGFDFFGVCFGGVCCLLVFMLEAHIAATALAMFFLDLLLGVIGVMGSWHSSSMICLP